MAQGFDSLTAALADRYRIERELGEGGMATVYLAHDERHDRSVAVKVLKPELAAVIGGERFLGEIRTTANLQHPHILPLFDSGEADGFLYYVMPYVDGETLQERLEREKQLPVDEAIAITTKVAAALQAAHDQGVIHRDIKPANILVSGGEPLVADFGIALAVSAAGGGRLTETGLSLGTPFYMSPEQAAADRDPDARSDVYSLACVLYEMLTGEPPHMGGNAQAVLARILTDAARPVGERRGSVPRNVEAAIARALEKLPADRFASAADFGQALADETYDARTAATSAAVSPGEVAPRRSRLAAVTPWVVAGVLGVAAAVTWLRPEPTQLVQRFPLGLEDLGYGGGPSLAISPDGSTIAYMGTDLRLYVRPISALEAQPVPGSEESRSPFFSPDGRSIGYTVGPAATDEIHTLSLDGAPPRTLAGNHFPGGAWGDDGFVYYVALGGQLFRVSEQGGEPEVLADTTSGYVFRFPHPLPGGGTLLVGAVSSGGGSSVMLFDIESRQVTPLLDGSAPKYVGGHLFWVNPEGTLFAAPFDAEKLELTGQGMELADDIRPSLQGSFDYAVSETGTLIYSKGGSQGADGQTLGWVTRGADVSIIDPRLATDFGDIDNLALSPDGRFVAVEVGEEVAAVAAQPSQIWIYDLELSTPTRLTFQGTRNAHPRWLPDGRTVAYLSNQGEGPTAVWAQPYDRSGSDEPLLQAEWPISGFDVSRDDNLPLILMEGDGPLTNLWTAAPGGDSVEPFLNTSFTEELPRISPDGRWVAYQSDESGRDEVYVRAFPDGGRPWAISREGGRAPVWSDSGDELFYLSTTTTVGQLNAAELEFGDELRVTSTTPLFFTEGMEVIGLGASSARYDVSEDGERLLVILNRNADIGSAEGVVLVLNVFEELEARQAN